jgi:hypothetical protein
MGKHSSSGGRRTQMADRSPDEIRLQAAENWGTALRFGFLRAVDRWPSMMVATACAGFPAAASAYARSRGWL